MPGVAEHAHSFPSRLRMTRSLLFSAFLALLTAGAWTDVAEWDFLPDNLDGSLISEYRLRHRSGETDQDIYEHLNLRVRELIPGYVSAYSSLRWHKDIDGDRLGSGYDDDIFRDLDDARDKSFPDRLYQLYLDIENLAEDLKIRAGRQYVDEADWLHLDGVSARLGLGRNWDVLAFAGRPVTYYSGTHNDWAGGAAVGWRYRPTGRARLLYYRYDQDETRAGDRFALDLWDSLGAVRVHARATVLDDHFDRLDLDASYYCDKARLQLDGRYSRLFHTLEDESLPFNPLYTALGDLQPYHYGQARILKFLGERWTLSGGITGRVVDGGDENATNQDYLNEDITLAFMPTEQWFLSLSAQRWDAEGDNRLSGLYGDATWRPNKQWELSAGAGVVDYVYEYYDDITFKDEYHRAPDARSYYLRARWRPRPEFALSARAELEDNVQTDDGGEDTFFSLRTMLSVYF